MPALVPTESRCLTNAHRVRRSRGKPRAEPVRQLAQRHRGAHQRARRTRRVERRTARRLCVPSRRQQPWPVLDLTAVEFFGIGCFPSLRTLHLRCAALPHRSVGRSFPAPRFGGSCRSAILVKQSLSPATDPATAPQERVYKRSTRYRQTRLTLQPSGSVTAATWFPAESAEHCGVADSSRLRFSI